MRGMEFERIELERRANVRRGGLDLLRLTRRGWAIRNKKLAIFDNICDNNDGLSH